MLRLCVACAACRSFDGTRIVSEKRDTWYEDSDPKLCLAVGADDALELEQYQMSGTTPQPSLEASSSPEPTPDVSSVRFLRHVFQFVYFVIQVVGFQRPKRDRTLD